MGRQTATGQAPDAAAPDDQGHAHRVPGQFLKAGLRAREWRLAPPMPRLPMRLHSGVMRHLTSPTVAGAAPELQLAKAMRAPDSRLNHRNSGGHLRGAHGSRIGWRLSGLRQPAKRSASASAWMVNPQSLLPPGEGGAQRRVRVRLLRNIWSTVPSPQPLSRRRGAKAVLLPSGEGAPKGRMRVRAKPHAMSEESACNF